MSTQSTTPMEAGKPSRRWGRSIGAFVAGFLAVVIFSLGTDRAACAQDFSAAWANDVGPTVPAGDDMPGRLRIVGSYITARLAPDRPMGHAMAGGFVGLLSIVGAAVTWKRIDLGPHWYPLALVVTALPCAWGVGKSGSGKFFRQRS